MEMFLSFLFLVFLEAEAADIRRFPDLNGMPQSPGRKMEEILQNLEMLTGDKLQELQKPTDRRGYTEVMLKLVLQDISKHCALRFTISPVTKDAPLNTLNQILWQLEGDKKGKGEIMCASDLHSREIAKHDKELGEVQKDTSKDGDVVLVYTNDTIEKNVEGVLLSMFYGKHTPEVESQTQKLHVHALYGYTEQIRTTQDKSEQKWQDRQGADDGKQPRKKYTLKQLLLLNFAIVVFVFSVILVVTFPTCWAIIHDQQKFTAKNMLEHSVLQDDNGESGPKSGLETLQYVLKKTSSKPHGEGFQVILGKQRKSATEGHHKKIKNNQKVTLMKCPQQKAQKGAKNRGINEPPFAESWEDRISYRDLPNAPPLPQESLWNYSEQSFLKYNFSLSPDNSGFMASETGTMDEYTEQLGSLYLNSYSSHRTKEGTPAEASSPIVIHINSPHHNYLPCSQAVDINNVDNSSNGLTLASDVCTRGSIASPHRYSGIEANAVPTSPAQTMYPGADNSISGAATFSTQSPSIHVVSNEPVVYNYYRQTGVSSAGYVPGMFRSPKQTLLSHIDGGPTYIYGQHTQSLSPYSADKAQDIAKPSICPQISCEKYKTKNNDIQLHTWSDWQKSKEPSTSETFHVTDRRPSSSTILMSVNNRPDRPDREKKIKCINNQQKLGLHSPRFSLKESIKCPNSYSESFIQDGIIPLTLASFIQPVPSYVPSNLHDRSNHASRSPSPFTDYELNVLYPHLHPTNLNSEERDNTVQNDTQQPKPTKIPITRIIQVSHMRSHSYSEPLSVQHEADNQSSPRRSRSISPQKSQYSLRAGQSTHSIHPHCYNEALSYNLSPGYAADNVHHPSTSSAVFIGLDKVQSIPNSSITDTYNAEDAFNYLTGPVSCDAEDGSVRQGTSEYQSGSAGLSPPMHISHQIQQTSRHSESPYNVGNSRHESEFSIYSPWPHIEARITNQAPIDLLCTGVNNTIKPLPTCTAMPEGVSNFSGQPVSPHTCAKAHEPYGTTQSLSTCFQDSRQNTSNSNTMPGFLTVDNKAQHLLCISNQSQPSNFENDRQGIPHVSFQSLATKFRDEEAKSDNPNLNPNDDLQHSFKSPTRSLTSNIINTQHAGSPISSHFNSDADNTYTYSSDHVENYVQTIPSSSSNLPLNAANEHPSEFSNTPLNLNSGLPAAPHLHTQTRTTHGDSLSNNSRSFTQSQPLSAVGEKENALCPSIQSASPYTLANKEGRGGHSNQCSNSSASQGKSNKHNTSDTVLHMLDFNGTDDQDGGSNFHNYSLFSYMNVSVGVADKPPSNSPTGEDDSFLPNASCSQIPSTSVDNTVEGVSYAFSQLMPTEFGESTQEILEAFQSSNSSTHSHFLSNEEKNISSSSIHSLSVQVNDNTLDEFRPSPKSVNTCIDEILTSNAPMPGTQVLDNAHCICSSARSPLFLTQDNAEGILIPPNHSQSTHATNCVQNTSHSMCQMPASHMSENIQDSTPSSFPVCTNGEAVRDLCDPTSLNTQNNNIKGVPHFSAEIIPDNPGNRQRIKHKDRSVNSSYEVNSAATHSIHPQFNSPRNNPSSSPPESLISFNNGQQFTSNFPTQLKQTNKSVIKRDSAYSSSKSVPSVHDKSSAISKASMHSLCTCIDPNKERRTNSSTPSLSSLDDNDLQRLPRTCNKTVVSNVAEDIHYVVTSCSQGSKQADQPATKSQHNFIPTTEDDRQDLSRKSRVPNLTPASCGSHRSAKASSSSAHSARSKAESSPSSSVHPQSVPVCYSDSPKCSSIPSLSETEEGKQRVSDFSNHSQFTCTANSEQTPASSNPTKNVRGIFHSFTTNGRPVFRTHIQSPQFINENTPDTAKHDTKLLPPNANEDEPAFCLSSQPRSTQVNTCAQDALFCLQPLSLYVNDNLQSLSPSLQKLSTENTRSESSSSGFQASSVSSKQQTATYSFNAACNNLQCDSDIHIQSNLDSTNLHGSSKQSILTDNNLQGPVTESSTQCRCNLTSNNLQGSCETSTQSWFNQVSNNQQGGSTSLTESCGIPVGNRPKVVSCSYTQTRTISNDRQVTSCSSIDTDNRSDKLYDFRPSQYSHSPHGFYRVKPTSRFSAQSSNSDHDANQDFLQSSRYLGEDQQTVPGVSTHRVKNVPGSSIQKYIDNSKQSPTRSSKFFHPGKVQGKVHHSYTKPHCSNKQNKYRSCNQPQSKLTTKIKPQAPCFSSLSPRCKCSTNLASNFSSTASSFSSFSSSTSPDDSSGDWSLSNTSIFTVSSEYLSSATSSMLRSLSFRSDDAASCISGFTFTTLYDDDDDDDILTAT